MVSTFVEVWTELYTFIVSQFSNITKLFYTPAAEASGTGSLTFVGVMAVIMAGVSIMLLVFNLIRSFFAMRG